MVTLKTGVLRFLEKGFTVHKVSNFWYTSSRHVALSLSCIHTGELSHTAKAEFRKANFNLAGHGEQF